MCARASQPLNIFAYVVSSTSAFSLRLMPFRLAVGSTPALTGSSAPPLPSLTVAQRVHPHHLPSSLHYTSNMTPPLYIGHDDLIKDKLNKKEEQKTNFHAPYLLKIWSLDHGPLAPSSHMHVKANMFPALEVAPVPPRCSASPPLCAK